MSSDQMLVETGVVDDPERVGYYSGFIESCYALMSFIASVCSFLAHSHPVDCRAVVEAFSEELKLPIVSYAEWMKQLERFSADEMADGGIIGESKWLKDIPALKILDFLRGTLAYESGSVAASGEVMGTPKLGVDNALKVSATLSGKVASIDASEVKLWLRFWRETGFLTY